MENRLRTLVKIRSLNLQSKKKEQSSDKNLRNKVEQKMLNIDLLYTIREKIPKNIRRILPKIIRRQIDRKFFKYYFLKTNFKNLPNLNYPEKGNLEYQKNLIEKFNFLEKQTSFMSCPYLIDLLSTKFRADKIFKKNIVVKQLNVLPQINYLFFFNRNSFFKIFLEKEYNLIFEKKNLTDEVNYDNFNYLLKDIQYSDFLFQKN